MFLHISGHVQSHGEGKVCVDLLFEHGEHVECVPHRVETQDARELLETRPGRESCI